MAHFAEIDENNIVKRVLVVDNSKESYGEKFLSKELKLGGRWIQTSYNNNFRKTFAGIGFHYSEEGDVFYPPQPYPSWTLNENWDWEAPTPRPEDEFMYNWDEENLTWIKLPYGDND